VKLLTGQALLQSRDEWLIRNQILAENLSRLVAGHTQPLTGRGLDVGCQDGLLTDYLNDHTAFSWEGIDPVLPGITQSPHGATLRPAAADDIPYADRHFDCLLFANVFEHIRPELRVASLSEMCRVLRPGGTVIGQIPNPYFPVESHSLLPFMGWLPPRLQEKYWRFSPVDWERYFWSVSLRHLRGEAEQAGLRVAATKNFNYPPEALPRAVRRTGSLLKLPMKVFPWAWQFVLIRSDV
jgi:SAM-dependent methyltransferase